LLVFYCSLLIAYSKFLFDVFLTVQILSAEQIRAWDEFTIQHEPVASVDLMERAAGECVQWLKEKAWSERNFLIFCGKGNNGGDGLAIARMLLQAGYSATVFVLENGKKGSEDFEINLQRLQKFGSAKIHFVESEADFPAVAKTDIVLDALFGSGLNKPLEGLAAQLVLLLNKTDATVVSIDLPSGLFPDKSSVNNAVIKASYTLTFQCYKLALLVQENGPFIGEVILLDIRLHPGYLNEIVASQWLLDKDMICSVFRPRNRFAHKGSFGHALIIGGSYGKMGAAVLATKACMSTGAGLTTAFIPKCGYAIMQTSAPEAMALVDEEETHLTNLPDDIEKFSAIGIGPGTGTHAQTQHLLSFVVRRYRKPLVIDADGLNCLALNKQWLSQLPPHSVLTPHPKEFDRLFGDHANDFERIEKAKKKAREHNVLVVLKGHRSFIAVPEGPCYFNSTGNAGMAKGGSGDVLTGILASLLAQGYSPADAALLGVYIHGWAGDFAAQKFSKEFMLPLHTIEALANVFLSLQ
jgi:hydroxyethylthiazole kinase-like uncharacterized protein yjeF